MRSGIRNTEVFKVHSLYAEGYSAEEIASMMHCELDCIKGHKPSKEDLAKAKKELAKAKESTEDGLAPGKPVAE